VVVRARASSGVLIAAVVAATAACVVPEIDLAGKACPCLDGWICDPATETCRRSSASTGTDAGSGMTGDVPAGLFDVLSFAGDWSTPESIHWTWSVAGEEADFHGWEVRLATSPEALDAGTDVLVFDGSLNPELDRFTLMNTQMVDAVTGTITDGLDPSTEYFARLHVLDTAGGRSSSLNVAVRSTTAPPNSAVEIFADESPFPPGFPLPECLERTDAEPYPGTTHHFSAVLNCDVSGVVSCTATPGGAPECFENLRLQGMNLSLSSLAAGDFASAFLEVHVAIDAPDDVPAHGWWSELAVRGSAGNWPAIKGVTLRADGSYRRYQIPLTQLGLRADTFDGTVTGFRVGSRWQNGTRIRFDEVRIRW
jgi:hypothetical protein